MNTQALKATIEKYSATTRQKIDFDNSCIQFGATTRKTTKSEVAKTMGIKVVEDA